MCIPKPSSVADMHPEGVSYLTDNEAYFIEQKRYTGLDTHVQDVPSARLLAFVTNARRSAIKFDTSLADASLNKLLQKLVKAADEVEAYYWWRLAKIEKGLRVEPPAPAKKGMF